MNVQVRLKEWGQVGILDYLATFTVKEADIAELIVDRVLSRLSHINPAVILAATKVLLKFAGVLKSEQILQGISKKVSSPLISLLNGPSESAWVLLRNIQTIVDRHPDVFPNARVFFTNYNDPPYVKIEKLKIIYKLSNTSNYKLVINELVEYSYDVNPEFSREAVRRLWSLSMRLPESLDACLAALHQILLNAAQNSFADHLINEAAIGVSYIYRKYSNTAKLSDSIAILVQHYLKISEHEALVGFLNLLPDFDTLIHNKKDVIANYSEVFTVSPTSVQSAILTAMVKLYVRNPDEFADEVIEILQAAADNVQNPDIRDRAFMYWRLLDISPVIAKKILFAQKEIFKGEPDAIDFAVSENFDHIGSLEVTMNLKPPKTDESKPLVRKEAKFQDMMDDDLISDAKEDLFDLDVGKPVDDFEIHQPVSKPTQNQKEDLFDVFGSAQKEHVKVSKPIIDIDVVGFDTLTTNPEFKSVQRGNKYNDLDILVMNTDIKPAPVPEVVPVVQENKQKGDSAFDFDMYDMAIKETPKVVPTINFKANPHKTQLPVNSVGRNGKTGLRVTGALIATDVDLSFHFEIKNSTSEVINFVKFKLMPNLYGFAVDNNAAKLELQPNKIHKMTCPVIPTDSKVSDWRLDNNHSFKFEFITDYDEFEFIVKSYVNSLMVC